jgi:hypothetical protein
MFFRIMIMAMAGTTTAMIIMTKSGRGEIAIFPSLQV